jgi:NodT family efflux transporter outer membrane factor (OMF) lipoprotein
VDHYTAGADPTQTVSAAGTAQQLTPGAPVPADWWQLFASPALDAVVREAIRANPGLDAAKASLRAANYDLRAGYGIFYPTLDASAGASRERYTGLDIGQSTGGIFNLFTVGASVSYALDLFGGERRMVEELHAGADLARAGLQATFLTLVTNVANTAIARAAYSAELAETERLVAIQREQLQLGEAQYQAGMIAATTLLGLRTQLAGAEASLAQLQQQLAQSTDLLANLCGHTPAGWSPPDLVFADLQLPQSVPVALPSSLVRQRPDILVAEAAAHAASANVGVATAALFPSITLSGGLSAVSNQANQLFPANGRAWGGAAGVNLPVFSGGANWYRRKAAAAQYDHAMALYRQTVNAAFAQVADTLQALDHDAALLRAETAAADDAAQALQLVQATTSAGVSGDADALAAESASHLARIVAIQAQAVRFQDSVALFAAVGGGWWHTGDPQENSR